MTKHYPVQVRGKKTCTRCGETKPRADFYSNSTMKDGRQSHCAQCQRAAVAQQRLSEPEKVRLARLKAHIKHKYGLTWENYLKWHEEQEGNCKICGDHYDLLATGGLQVDHDHDTGVVRGLLCRGCNLGIGHLGESVRRLRSAIAYLEAAQASAG